jgi:hypothetical protein
MSDEARELTAKEVSQLTGRSVTWLRTHECGWCGQSALDAARGRCAAVYERCDPAKRIASLRATT